NPRDHADHIRGPERNRAKQGEYDLPGFGSDVEREKIGNRESDQQRQNPGQQTQFQGLQIGFQDRAQAGQFDNAPFERIGVTAETEGGEHFIFIVVPRADDRNKYQRQQKKQREDQHHRRGLKPRDKGFAVLKHLEADVNQTGAGLAGRVGPATPGTASSGDEFVPLAHHVIVLVYDGVPAGDAAHAVVLGS